MTIEELQAQLEEMKTQNAASIAKLEAKNRELLAEKQTTKAEADKAREAAEQAAAEAAAKTGNLDAIKAQHAKDLKKAQDTAAETQAKLATLLIDNTMRAAMTEAGVAPVYQDAFAALMSKGVEIVNDVPVVGGIPLTDHVKSYASSDVGKAFVAAPANSGGNAVGSKIHAPEMTRDSMSLDAMSELMVKDVSKANSLLDSFGLGDLKV